MAVELKQTTSLYEILIRVQPDGSWAAHYQTLTTISGGPNGDISSPGPATVLDRESPEAFALVEGLIGEAAASNLNLAQQLQAELAVAQDKLEFAEKLAQSYVELKASFDASQE